MLERVTYYVILTNYTSRNPTFKKHDILERKKKSDMCQDSYFTLKKPYTKYLN